MSSFVHSFINAGSALEALASWVLSQKRTLNSQAQNRYTFGMACKMTRRILGETKA
jgi:hypothetical protein